MSLFLDRPDDLDAVWAWAMRQPGLDWDSTRIALASGGPVYWMRTMDGATRVGLVVAAGRGRASVYLHPSAAEVAPEIPDLLAGAGYVGGTVTDFVPALADALDASGERSRERQWWTRVVASTREASVPLAQPEDEAAWFVALYDACYGPAGSGAEVWLTWTRDPQFGGRRVWFLAEEQHPVAFYAAARERAGEEMIRWIGTRPERRRSGLGRALVLSAMSAAARDGCFSASAVVTAGNAAAKHLLRSAGFHRLWRLLAWGRR